MSTTEIGESFSPPPPMIVSEDSKKFYYSDISNNEDLIAYANTPTRPKWEAKTI